MTDQHRDKDQQNYLIRQARAIYNEAKLIAELIHRIEALEAATTAQPEPVPTSEPEVKP